MQAPTLVRTCLHALVPAGALIFNTRVFLKSSIALHHNCNWIHSAICPVFIPNSHWLTPSIPSHRRLPAPTGTGLKEHLSHHSCQFTAATRQYRGWGIAPFHPPTTSEDLSRATGMELLRNSCQVAQRALLGLHTLTCPRKSLPALCLCVAAQFLTWNFPLRLRPTSVLQQATSPAFPGAVTTLQEVPEPALLPSWH